MASGPRCGSPAGPLVTDPAGVGVPALVAPTHRPEGSLGFLVLLARRQTAVCWRLARGARAELLTQDLEVLGRLDAQLYSPSSDIEDFDEDPAFNPEPFLDLPIKD